MIKMMEDRCYLCKEASNQKSLESRPPPKWRKLGDSKGGGAKTKFRALGDLLKELLIKQDENVDDTEKLCRLILKVRAQAR